MFPRRFVQNSVVLLVSILGALILLEIALRVLTPYPVSDNSNTRFHPRLAYVLKNVTSDIDERGFRNHSVKIEEADLVAIGDSHAYGENVAIGDNFPSRIGAATGLAVYNLGLPSYGIYQYKVLMDEILPYSPKFVVLALYPANDLAYDCKVLGTRYWRDYGALNEIEIPHCRRSRKKRPDAETAPRTRIERIERSLRRRLLGTATLQIVHSLMQRSPDQLAQSLADGRRLGADDYHSFADGQFVNKQRLLEHAWATSLDDPHVRTNFQNSKTFFLEGHRGLEASSVELLVLLVPSKEIVLREYMIQTGRKVAPDIEALMQNEIALTIEYERFFKKNGIASVSALPELAGSLRDAIEAGQQVYPKGDGHPGEAGYQAYADAALRGLQGLSDEAP